MKQTTKIFMTAVLSVGILISMTACGSSGNDKDKSDNTGKTKVRIAYFPNITHTQALILKNQKTLENQWKDTCEVSWTSFNAGPAEIEALFAEEIDIGYIGPVPAISASVKSDGDIRIISNAANAGTVLLTGKDSDIQSVKDLSGKKIAVPQLGNTQHLCLLSLLEDSGLKTADKGGNVTISASSNADILNLMGNGSVDAALVPEPWGSTIEKTCNANVLLDYDKVFWEGNYPVTVVVAREDFIEEHPGLVKDFLKAHEDVSRFINDNAKKSQEIVNQEIEGTTGKSIAADVIQRSFNRIRIDTNLNQEAIMKFASLSKAEGFITKVPEEKNVFKTEYN